MVTLLALASIRLVHLPVAKGLSLESRLLFVLYLLAGGRLVLVD
jgi:hypothetical protein